MQKNKKQFNFNLTSHNHLFEPPLHLPYEKAHFITKHFPDKTTTNCDHRAALKQYNFKFKRNENQN